MAKSEGLDVVKGPMQVKYSGNAENVAGGQTESFQNVGGKGIYVMRKVRIRTKPRIRAFAQ